MKNKIFTIALFLTVSVSMIVFLITDHSRQSASAFGFPLRFMSFYPENSPETITLRINNMFTEYSLLLNPLFMMLAAFLFYFVLLGISRLWLRLRK